jgi:ribonuclease P protein component
VYSKQRILAKQFTLGKNERLKSRKLIGQLFEQGKKIMVAPYKVLYLLNGPVDHSSLVFGAGVSVKNFKKAVDRNRVKRLTREAYRLQKKELEEKIKASKSQLSMFFIYTGKQLPAYDEVYKKIGTALKKLEKLTAS